MMRKQLLILALVLSLLPFSLFGAAAEVPCATASAGLTLPQVQESDSLSFLATDPSIETEENYPATQYFYSQLNDAGKQIYQALADPENLPLLKRGEAVTVGEPYVMTIPAKTNQAEYSELVAGFTAHSALLGTMINEASNAAAAFDRDRVDVFWTSGVYAETAVLVNGVLAQDSVSFSPGNTYTLMLRIKLPLVSDWDRVGESDRNLEADITLLDASVCALAQAAALHSTNRYRQISYLNEQLSMYNDYNTSAATAGGKEAYGSGLPWTPLSALDQMIAANDADGGLKPVCEGYARALKLLCDALEIPCITVSGNANGEEHMWNYVQMEDGCWYAVDATWNDSTGKTSYLLVGRDVMDQLHTPHNRFMASGQTASFRYPVLSAESYDPNQLTLQAQSEALLGGGALLLRVGGILDVTKICLVCSDISITLAANGDGSWTATLPNLTAEYRFTATYEGEGVYHGVSATCTVQVTEHTHSYNGKEKHDAAQHALFCTCQDVIYEPHTFGDWTEVTAPTEKEEGLRERSCACGELQSEPIPLLTHSYAETVVAPTCTEKGYTEHVCVHCGDTYRDSEQDATGHRYSDESPETCVRCGASKGSSEQATTDKQSSTGSPNGGSMNSISDMLGCSASVENSTWLLFLAAGIASLALMPRKKKQH